MPQLTLLTMLGLTLNLRRSWTHLLLPFSDAMYKAVWPSYIYLKGQIQTHNKWKLSYKWLKKYLIKFSFVLVTVDNHDQNVFKKVLTQN